MSEYSSYLRAEAEKCRAHARAITSSQTQADLRELADEYLELAAEIESKEAVRLAPQSPADNPRLDRNQSRA